MRFLFFIVFCSVPAIGYSQSYLLSEGQSSTTLPLQFASQGGETQIGTGYTYSKNGKFDLGLDVDYLSNSSVFIFSPFYRKFLYNDPDADGPAFAAAVNYIMLLDQNGGTAHLAAFTPSFYYRIPTKKVTIVPQFDAQYTKALETRGSGMRYGVRMNLAFATDKGYITLRPRYEFGDNGNNLFSLRMDFQWVRSKE